MEIVVDKAASSTPQGCSFLVEAVGSQPVFTPEQITDDQMMFYSAAQEFMEREVIPRSEEIDSMVPGLMPKLLKRAGEAGLLMAEVPEAFGGLDLEKVVVTLISEQTARQGSFGTAFGATTGIGTLPIVFFGTDAQKQRYLLKLATGELLAAYALTEPNSGSDALGAKTQAVLSEDGSEWILNGQKIWITNAGFADIFIVFAKVDGEHFSGFIVESNRPGFSTGEEEKKMGLKGSSTRMLFLDDVHIPKENLLGEIGRGHKIAFNILNLGRLKLGAGSIGAAKPVFDTSVRYANMRHQFKRPIASFGAIQQKIADMALLIFAGEAMAYRVAGAMDQTLHTLDPSDPDWNAKAMAGIEEFAVEASILKVFGSEAIAFVADQGVQIHGGLGFSAEYAVEKVYRDVRVNRIFEGTNEINRMLIPGIILKRTVKGELNLFAAIQAVEAALAGPKVELPEADEAFAVEVALTELAKKTFLMAANVAIQKYMTNLRDQQQLLLTLADLVTSLYVMDSTVARVKQMQAAGKVQEIHRLLASVMCAESYRSVIDTVDALLPSLAKDDKLSQLYVKLEHLKVRPGIDLIKAKRAIAAHFIEREKYSV
ncbi:MAG: hypothetical protein AUK47_19125 [Deltaproteobacteria bacterium CG2_30_63_29]|nr:MAG: hypothetical protein AUK47_19125 [Deltaproteobacteria bacterium CG2_30_63_29]PIV98729.1 MAG: acyl-CoA dehydrogenase [Deltaproteobacteria bacterium CG17_big_fil_post_rev_8_21_14_2_50_63_7]PJB38949.1 MAG: acyl-CoA dehydrogenase [Deltaproteobacteria bacterium CG_4_9_14_3_um_filter_63_12]